MNKYEVKQNTKKNKRIRGRKKQQCERRKKKKSATILF